ncbi:formiminotransferase N-terminal subdomain-containing protein [Callorhinchus milii]|uniref:Formiminotransferase cyclodeaminase N-terminal like 1 n=1 Tax=Callorhinchus milii TaxID=7868 RepID=A0A4W3ITT1_CALMI|nr:formiminotransferase N-terminal subdomain-containing protein [Callorhinchus milii]XP_007898264.1 formiminotransferase N-terminal subdomain-containing protein [Callorhinchus milii]XP_007898265.1 formiminotransferase N-terminal subdomain-containing protein [Callorhinchus milii]XP_007898266.1 formiminotransferase N-terminal subdomain-containing protein [Callorhinchus milii]XP_007898267.1 formiminotransferase N-terminal subdomain-containing protein [Callorhinchus milii]XP_042192502.1 formiminot|eukprot:gi/632964160/ref/XP_007898263.1/ PREDICTED: uncharacterized protein LOC103182896 [Callorhinchus milii]
MASSRLALRLAACLLNISEARNQCIVEKVAQAAVGNKQGQMETQATVLNIFSDYDYNRSVLTIVAPIETLGCAIVAACTEAYKLIDMEKHSGIHPCLGAVDLVPIYPLSESVGLGECAKVAHGVAERLTHAVPECSMFYFGYADQPLKRSLVQRRKESGWFRKSSSNMDGIKPDVGTVISPRYGLTGIGASAYVMNCNVTINTQDLAIGQRIARAIRGASVGGLQGIQAMAFPHGGRVEIACNVESLKEKEHSLLATHERESRSHVSYRIQGESYQYVSPSTIERQIKKMADSQGVTTVGTALVGFTPERCKSLAEQAILQGTGMFWKEHKMRKM